VREKSGKDRRGKERKRKREKGIVGERKKRKKWLKQIPPEIREKTPSLSRVLKMPISNVAIGFL